ncbi:MAG: hypothetical protein ACON4Z_12550, partial [Planctomycetota bacterium]
GEAPAAPAPTVAAAASGPEVTVEATLLEALAAPPREAGLAVRGDGAPLPARVVAGAGAGVDVDGSPRGRARVAGQTAPGSLLRHLSVDPVQPRQIVVGARVQVRGVVVDEQEQPSPGGSVWFGELDATGAERAFPVDESGAFSADVPAGDGVPFVARGPAAASVYRIVEVRPGMPTLRAALRPAGALHVQLAGRAVEVERARAFVVPVAGSVGSSVAQWPFFAQLRSDGYPFDERGEAVVPDLPRAGEISVVVRHPLSALAAPVQVTLSGARQRVTVPITFGERALTGEVVDPRGEPVAGAWVFGRAPNASLGRERSSRLLPPFLGLRGVFVARSDARGRFSVGVPDARDAGLAVRRAGFAGRDLLAPGDADLSIQLDDWHGGDASLRVTPPVDDAPWRLVGGGVSLDCAAGVEGVLALPQCGRYRLRLEVRGDGVGPATVELPEVAVTGPVTVPSSR